MRVGARAWRPPGLGRERRLYGLLLRAYPRDFRAEYGSEMAADFMALRMEGSLPGVWARVVADVARSAPRERWDAWRAGRERVHAARRARGVPEADVSGAVVAAIGVFVLYWITLAPTTAFWDAGEYITVAHVLGIPHPPGNPLFVFVARVWELALGVTGLPGAVRINAFSAVCSALAHLFLFLCIDRAFAGAPAASGRAERRVAAGIAVLMSATAFTVWSQSNVNEKVYTVSFLTTLATAWLALRWRDTRDPRLLVLAVYVTALTAANHLMGVLVAPALLVFVWCVERRSLLRARLWAAALPAVLLAGSAQLFLPIRAAERPLVNESDPTCESLTGAALSIYTGGAGGCEALSATLRREQYPPRSMFDDPNAPGTRRPADLVAAQFVNYAQYLDWQWARSIAGGVPLFGGARPYVTLLLLALMIAGATVHWRVDRHAALLHGVLLATLSVGLVLYLNFRWGFSINLDAVPDPGMHEVRERDYFFLISFSLTGAWAGLGIVGLWQHAARHFGVRRRVVAPVLALAVLPLVLNWSWASRADDWTARDWAYNVLMSVEPYGVLVTNGDNDSFPLWYLQHVERIREDVTIVLAPYLATEWYARQVRDASRPCPAGVDPAATPTVITCQRPFRADQVHPRLLAAWGGAPAEPPGDSVLPLTDGQIAQLADGYFIAERPLPLQVAGLDAQVEQGTFLTPIDTFVAAMVQGAFDERPIHFMAPSSVAQNLGLLEHTVRVGLTYRLNDGRADRDLVAMPATAPRASLGAWVDLAVTDTLLDHVFLVRGRVADPGLPWVDHANLTIPTQYTLAHYAAAIAHDARGNAAAVQRHMRRIDFWNRFIPG